MMDKISASLSPRDWDIIGNALGLRPYAEVAIGEIDGVAQGFALYFHNFSTFEGKPGIYLEDLFVRPALRGRGIASELVRGALELIRADGRKVIAGCGFVVDYLRRNPEFADLTG